MRSRLLRRYFISTFASLVGVCSAVASTGITYQGRILRPDGTPFEAPSVTITVQISSPGSENCLLLQETHSLNMTNSGGVFSITIGNGARVSSSIDGGFPIARIFANDGAELGPLPTCSIGAAYTPGSTDTRRLTISFNDGYGVQTLQTQNMNFVPYAVEAKQVGGYDAEHLLRVDGVTASPMNATEYGELQDLIAGSSSLYTKANELGGTALPALSAGQSLRWNGSGWEGFGAGSVVNSITAGTGLDVNGTPGASITSTGTLNLTDTGVVPDTYGDTTNIPRITVDAQGRLSSVTNVPLASIANFSGSLSGDVTGTQGATAVEKIRGVNVAATAPVTGQTMRFDGTNWTPAVPNVADLRNADGDPQLPTNCSASETLTFDSPNDKFVCTPISVASFSGSLAGDVSGPMGATVVDSVGGASAANVAFAVNLALTATDANTAAAVVRRDASGNFAASQITATSFVGNLTGTATNTEKIRGQSVNATPPAAEGQVLRWDGTSEYVARHLHFQDLKSAASLTQIPTTCTTEQVMVYSSLSDTFVCQTITLANTTGVMTGDVTGSIVANTVSKLHGRDLTNTAPGTGDVIKWNGTAWAPSPEIWGLTASNAHFTSGNVGIGTTTPTSALEVAGQIKITGGSPGAGKILVSDADGMASWQTPVSDADHLGNHIAGQNIQLGSYWLSGDGQNEGLTVSASGNVGIGTNNPGALLDLGAAGSIPGVIRLQGSTSGYAALQASPAAGNVTLTLPATTGTLALTGSHLGTFGATTSAQLAGVISDETGTGALVFGTSPTLTSPTLTAPNIGAATATTVNKLTITPPATGATLTIANGKTLTASNTLTFTGTDSSSVNFGAGGTVAYTSSNLSAFGATTSAQLAGVISDETGTGALVFGTSPTFSTNITTPMITGGTTTTSTLTLKTTSAAGTTGADMIFRVGNNGATEAMRILNSGNVGIGTSNPANTLDVQGSIRARLIDNGSSRTINWAQGNVQTTTAGCDGTNFTMNNMLDGASYTLILKATSHSGVCAFTGSGVSNWRFRPAAARPSGYVVLTLLKAGTDVFIAWAGNY